jgi:hypothetical protein
MIKCWTPASHPLVCRSVQAAIAGDQLRRSTKDPLMVMYGRGELPLLAGLVREHRKACDDLALHLIEDDQAPKLDRRPPFVPRDDAAVRLKQTHQLLLSCDQLPRQHAAPCLANDLLDHRRRWARPLASIGAVCTASRIRRAC